MPKHIVYESRNEYEERTKVPKAIIMGTVLIFVLMFSIYTRLWGLTVISGLLLVSLILGFIIKKKK
jgi:hypothetical protein